MPPYKKERQLCPDHRSRAAEVPPDAEGKGKLAESVAHSGVCEDCGRRYDGSLVGNAPRSHATHRGSATPEDRPRAPRWLGLRMWLLERSLLRAGRLLADVCQCPGDSAGPPIGWTVEAQYGKGHMTLSSRMGAKGLTVQDARQLAAALLGAAERLERAGRGGR
jgi:hypothetical protein